MFPLKNETPKQQNKEKYFLSATTVQFFLPYTEQLIEITVIKRLFGIINIII